MRRTPTRTAPARAAAVFALAALLAGCGLGDEGPDDGTVTLDYLSLAWQAESVEANKALVDRWNAANPDVRVRYVQGSWDNVHDQLLTSFMGGEAPDIIHNDASDLTDFAYGGYLADLTDLLPPELRADIPEQAWGTTTFDGGVYGVPFLQEPRVLIANAALLADAGVRIPTTDDPWTWEEFEDVAADLTRDTDGDGETDTYGVAWSMSEPVSQSVNLSLSTGGQLFYRDGGENEVRYGAADSAVAELIHRQVNEDGTAPRSSLGMGGSDTLPGFFADRYALLPLNFSFRQQVAQQAPDGFGWSVLPMPSGGGDEGLAQGVAPQTLSVAQDSDHRQAAADFIAFLTRADHAVELARGDWMLPTSTTALADPSLSTEELGWRTGVELAAALRPSPVLGVRGYPEWKDKIATPAFQEYYNGAVDLEDLREELTDDGNRILDRYQR
ncbi:ABC transporter substrate-binding protein [Streptomyces radicis]|uniref:Sugar ABC transporter substrate-binding protein n=1 Tax=Streptomyces radicis TaxID=1750517 RepID=A0A3A9W861_9ACTN|nr:sugar ABC transporter substrate-binding protein [Streptomyces radicis]RKN09298.1 sugar ABC transporter substrate-binding protein [Streptomyces radicis]RKN23104.1 sugar ABC transporter substrate-binding protein [Streptomyces radicis]